MNALQAIEREMEQVNNLMYDDLKDAQMNIDYGKEAMHTGNKDGAVYFFDSAKKRLSMFTERHTKFVALVKEHREESPESKVADCVCCRVAHKQMTEWYEKMKHACEMAR